jgi:hypothetical protein
MHLRTSLVVDAAEPSKKVWLPPVTLDMASSKHDGTWYSVTRLPDGSWSCSCPDHQYRHKVCKHITKARIQCGEVEDVDVGDLL